MEYLVAILKRKTAILMFVLAATVVSVVVSLLLPKWYKSSVSLLPPRQQGMLGGLSPFSALLKDFAPTGAASRLGSGGGGVNYLAILKSRRASESIIQRFDLMKVYAVADNSMEKALAEYEDNRNIEINDDGSIRLEMADRDSVRAADMANALVETLNAIAIELGTSEARNNRQFLEKRAADTRTDLSAAEEKLKHFQETNGMMVLSEDAKASASAIGELFARKVKMDIELSILSKTTGEDNSSFRQMTLEKNEIERKLSTFPQLGMESFRLFRDVLIQQKILEFLVPMYEQARLEEQKDIPVVLVLDKATPAERKSRPKRTLIVGTTALTALILSLMTVVVAVRFQIFKTEHPDRYQSLRTALGGRVRV